MAVAHYRMVEGRDWLWDFLGKNCREILFESWGLHDSNEHFPVSATFSADDGSVKQLTVETGTGFYRWMDPSCHPGYILACADLGEKPWAEPGLTWIEDAETIVAMIAPALHPERRPSDTDESYRWDSGDIRMDIEREETGEVRVNP
jgi:hypothetical protein